MKTMSNETQRASRPVASRIGERGGSTLKFLIILAVLILVGYIGYQYVPVAIHAYQYKDFMQQTVDKGAYNQSSEWVRTQLKGGAVGYDVPPDANITATLHDGRMEARVQFTRPIPLPGYIYQYTFDYTAKSSNLLSEMSK